MVIFDSYVSLPKGMIFMIVMTYDISDIYIWYSWGFSQLSQETNRTVGPIDQTCSSSRLEAPTSRQFQCFNFRFSLITESAGAMLLSYFWLHTFWQVFWPALTTSLPFQDLGMGPNSRATNQRVLIILHCQIEPQNAHASPAIFLAEHELIPPLREYWFHNELI